jgi:hypothetical protein
MNRFLVLALLSTLALTGCASGFDTATAANTARDKNYQDNLVLQAARDLAAVNMCYLHAGGYALKSATGDPVKDAFGEVVRVGDPYNAIGCTVMATALRTQSNMASLFAPFISQTLMARVPAAPEEIVQNLIEKGLQFSLFKFGIESVSKVVSSGQAAQTQLASEGMAAAAKPPLVIEVPVGSQLRVFDLK